MGREAPVTADTFLSVPACDVSHLGEGVDVVIVGAPDGTPCTPGEASHARDAPDAMRRSIKAAASDLTRWDFDQNGPLLAKDLTVRNAGNIVTDPATPGRNRENIRAAIRAILDASAVPVLLGGDDSGRFRSLKHSKRTDRLPLFKLMHISTGAKRETALRYTFSSPMRRASEMPLVERIVQVGIRGIGASRKGDLDDALHWGARIISASTWREASSRLHSEGARCVITIDCDGLDPSVIPGVLVPQPGGLSFTDMMALFDGLATKASIEGVDVVELVPSRDVNEIGAFTAARKRVSVARAHYSISVVRRAQNSAYRVGGDCDWGRSSPHKQ